jgi:pyrimidine deaminase RibD-like protein
MISNKDNEFMRLAIEEAKKSRNERNKISPLVGAVVVRNGNVVSSASRGEGEAGRHAEFTAMDKKLKPTFTLAGSTVYTTLEPCTTRNHPKVPCATRLVERHVKRVVIGMLDPDQRITGKGVIQLRKAGIEVDFFPHNLMMEIEEMNREFTRDREGSISTTSPKGVTEAGITTFYPSRRYYALLRDHAATIDRYVATASESVVLVSINLMTGLPFDTLCQCLDGRLKSKSTFKVSVSLLNPGHSELMAVMAPVLNQKPDKLARSITESLKELLEFKSRLPKNRAARLSIRVHNTVPSGSAILLDHKHADGRIQVETKPYKAGVNDSYGFEVAKHSEDGLYAVLAKAYETLLTDGQELGHDDLNTLSIQFGMEPKVKSNLKKKGHAKAKRRGTVVPRKRR